MDGPIWTIFGMKIR